jgi:long-chain fatty acid transport protein
MESNFKRSLIAALVTGYIAAPATSHATNGLFMIGYGAKSVAMGGAAIANPQDALAGAVNPAAVGVLGNRFEIGTELFRPEAHATLAGLEQDSVATHNDSLNLFIIPHIGYSKTLSPNTTFGFSFVGAGGGGSRYEKNLFINASTPGNPDVNKPLGISLDIAQMNPTLAVKFNETNTIGATLILSFQKFRAIGLDYFNPFTSTFVDTGADSTTLTDNGNDYAYGAGLRLGWLGKFMNNRLMLGAMGSSKVYMTKFDKYSDLFAEQGKLDTPAIFGVGLGFKVTPKLTTALDITYTMYEDVKAIGNAPPARSGISIYPVSPAVNALGKDGGLGFGWQNQTVFKFGLAYDMSDKVVLRTGWNYGKSPIPSDNGALLFSIVAPATTQNHFTLGATYRSDPTTEWNFMYMYAFGYTQSGPAYIGNIAEIGMRQNSLGITYGMKF